MYSWDPVPRRRLRAAHPGPWPQWSHMAGERPPSPRPTAGRVTAPRSWMSGRAAAPG